VQEFRPGTQRAFDLYVITDVVTGRTLISMVITFFASGSMSTIFLPLATHSFAHLGPVPVNTPALARPLAQTSSDSHPLMALACAE
jgi:hypothetical protein